MKLSIFSLISSSIAVDTEYRLITNKDGWQTMPTPSWWDSKPMTTRYNTLRKNAGRFVAHIQTEKDSDGNNIKILNVQINQKKQETADDGILISNKTSNW